jgi:hypothetical protein
VSHLSLNERVGLARKRTVRLLREAKDHQGIRDRGKGISQFVREHRHEFVLVPIGGREFIYIQCRTQVRAFPFSNVANVALDELVAAFLILVADDSTSMPSGYDALSGTALMTYEPRLAKHA